MRSLRPTFFKLLESFGRHILVTLNLRIFLFKFVCIIHIGNQYIVGQTAIVDRIFSVGVIGKFFSNVS